MEFNPSLFIGFGGTGYIALSKIKKKLQDLLHTQDLPPSFQFLVIDIDITKPKDLYKNDPAFEPDGDEMWCPLLPPLDDFYSLIAQGIYPFLKEWLPKNIHKVLKMHKMVQVEEAYQHRCIGRAALFIQADNFFSRIHKKFELVKEAAGRKVIDIDAKARGRPMIYIVASLAGGTGSGMFLDGGAIARIIANDAELTGIFFLPDMFMGPLLNTGHDTEIPYVNTYGSLKELDYFQIGESTHEFNVQYSDKLHVKDVNRIFDMVYLIDKTREEHAILTGTLKDRNHVAAAVADFVVANITIERWGGGGGLAQHVGGRHQIDNKSLSKFYSSFGAAVLEYPLDLVLEYAKHKLAHLLSERLRSGEQNIEHVRALIDGDPQSGIRAIWHRNGVGDLMPLISVQSAFRLTNIESFKGIKKKELAQKIEQAYKHEIRGIKSQYLNFKKTISKWPQDDVQTTLKGKIQSLLRNGEKGLPSAIKFLEELLERVRQCKKDHQPTEGLAGDFEKVFMKDEDLKKFIKEYQETFLGFYFWGRIRIHVGNLVLDLAKDLEKGIRTIKNDLKNLACQGLEDYIGEELFQKLKNTENELITTSNENSSSAEDVKEEIKLLRSRKLLVGVDEYIFERGGYVENKLDEKNILVGQELVLRNHLADRFECPSDEIIRRVSEGIQASGLEKENIFDKLDVGKKLTNQLSYLVNEARPMWPLAAKKYTGLATANTQKRILAYFDKGEVTTKRKAEMPAGVEWVYTDITDQNTILALVLNPGKPFEYLKMAQKCYELYLTRDLRARKDKQWQSTVLPESRVFPELVPEGITGIDANLVERTAKKLGLMSKLKSGRIKIVVQIDPEIKTPSFATMKKFKGDIRSNRELAQHVRKTIVKKIMEMGRDEARRWLYDNSHIIPDLIANEVKQRLGIDESY